MNAIIPAAIVLATLLSVTPAKAEDHATTKETVTTTVETTTAPAPENYTLENGTAVVVEDGKVFTVDTAGVRTPAPTGDHATKEGKVLTVLDGALVIPATKETVTETTIETTKETAE